MSLNGSARKEEIEPYGDLILGVDPAGGGTDFTAIAWRKGHTVTKIMKRKDLDTMQTVGWLGQIIREDKPARLKIAISGVGMGRSDRLCGRHWGEVDRGRRCGGRTVEPPALDESGRP